MSAQAFEAFLAKIYVDAEARERYHANPLGEAASAGLSPEECSAIAKVNWAELELTAASFAGKRVRKRKVGFWTRWRF